jgi:putative Mn2+ efflux pump MntP
VAAKLVALVLPLGLDTFAVAAALGAAGVPPTRRLRIAIVFTIFEAGMPLVGLALGAPLGRAIGSAADYVAIGVLIVFGVYTLLSSGRDEHERLDRLTRPGGVGTILLGVSISLDELAVGFTFGLLQLPVVLVIVLVAVQAFVAAQLGLRLGARLSERLREGAERVAGVALAALGLVLLLEKAIS